MNKKVKFEGYESVCVVWQHRGHGEAKAALLKSKAFRDELKRHGIGIRLFCECGRLYQYMQVPGIRINMSKYNNVYDYRICKIEFGYLESELPLTDREKLQAESEKWNTEEYSVEVCRKYFYVCRNNGAFHRGDAGHLGGYAAFVGKFNCNGDRVYPRA